MNNQLAFFKNQTRIILHLKVTVISARSFNFILHIHFFFEFHKEFLGCQSFVFDFSQNFISIDYSYHRPKAISIALIMVQLNLYLTILIRRQR